MTRVEDVTGQWDELLAGLEPAWPYHTSAWGEAVAAVFGGSFRVFAVDTDGASTRFLPVLVGGALAQDAYVSGHIGYGGALAEGVQHLPLSEHLRCLRLLDRSLGLPCGRLSLPPTLVPGSSDGYARSTSDRHTTLVSLAPDEHQRTARYAGSVRARIRRCRRAGLRVASLRGEDLPGAARLVHNTQRRAGATYRTPVELFVRIHRDQSLGLLLGCWLGAELIATGVFLRTARRAVFLSSGWDRRHAAISPNYLLINEAFRRCADDGDTVMDMGYSHQPGIAEFKARWGGHRVPLISLPDPTSMPTPADDMPVDQPHDARIAATRARSSVE